MEHVAGILQKSVLAATLFGLGGLTLGTAEQRMWDSAHANPPLSSAAWQHNAPEGDLGWG
ncbi:hypothetical protein ACFYRC_16615 [Streptomyces sp. NPDC005279]|uniref:hypothetical protein n=1 Tax=Streptomyces sp. NPDC005279 TaxID=3364712 RepID=UPI0036CB61EF